MSADKLQGCFWVGFALVGLLTGALQKRGYDYFPANLLLGLALGLPGTFYLTVLTVLGSVEAVRQWATAYRVVLIVYSLQLAMACWAFFLVTRVNGAKPGSTVDIWGRIGLPHERTIERALAIIGRADRHDMLNAITRGWLGRDLSLRKATRMAAERYGPERDGEASEVRLLWRELWRRLRRRRDS